jgi:hypothetical protein
MTNVRQSDVNLNHWPYLVQESSWCKVGFSACLAVGGHLGSYLPTYLPTYLFILLSKEKKFRNGIRTVNHSIHNEYLSTIT